MTGLGTIYKLNIHIDGLPGTMDDVSFTAVFFCFQQKLEISKEEMIRVDENNYIAVIDSTKIGRGIIKMKLTVEIPDSDIPGGLRKEVYTHDTGIRIA